MEASSPRSAMFGLGSPLREVQLSPSCTLALSKGSVLDFKGDAFVNAANEGCVAGFGLDEQVNLSGGFELKEARKQLGGCPTGSARITPSFQHHNTNWIIHAVGPVYRFNQFKHSGSFQDFARERDVELASAYRSSLSLAEQHNLRTVAFSILSAGVFRGEQPLEEVLAVAVRAIAAHVGGGGTSSLEKIVLVAYTREEELALSSPPVLAALAEIAASNPSS